MQERLVDAAKKWSKAELPRPRPQYHTQSRGTLVHTISSVLPRAIAHAISTVHYPRTIRTVPNHLPMVPQETVG